MACRRVEAGEEEASSFAGLKGSYEVMKMDLAHLQSVRDFVDGFLNEYDRLDGLMCNAGLVVMGNRAALYTRRARGDDCREFLRTFSSHRVTS